MVDNPISRDYLSGREHHSGLPGETTGVRRSEQVLKSHKTYMGGIYVDWKYMREHEKQTREGFQRLDRIEAEMFGDDQSGRRSLREEFMLRIDQSDQSRTEQTKSLRRAMWGAATTVLAGLILHGLLTFFNIHTPHP